MNTPSQPQEERKKRLQAAALKYDATQDEVPRVVGLGQGLVAENMVRQARENDVPVVENPQVARSLMALGLGDDIPEELYQVVAEILVFVAKLDEKRGNRYGMP